MTPETMTDEDGQMGNSVAARVQDHMAPAVRVGPAADTVLDCGMARKTGVETAGGMMRGLGCALVLALAGCAQPGATPGAAAPGQAGGQAGAQTVFPGFGGFQMPTLRWPSGGIFGTAAGGTGAATQQVTDPFAGQGVKTPAAVAGQQAAAAGTAATTHTVVAGETAWSIARRYGITVQELARANGLSEAMSVRTGQRLAIPATGAGGQVVVAAPGVGSATPQPPSSTQPLPNEQTRPVAAATAAPAASAPNLGQTRTAASGSGKFAMPASGSIIRTYRKGTNEGIDIAAAPGSAVKAAAGGTVAAVTRDTDGVPIVVVRHDDGLMTVYAGVDKLSVNKGDSVSRGQSIGAARSSGVLHFEVRKGFDSVDPEGYL